MKQSNGQRPNVRQAQNLGYGVTKADLARGHLEVGQPVGFENPHPQRAKFYESPNKGFVDRSPFSTERT